MTPLAFELLEDVYGHFYCDREDIALFDSPEEMIRWLRTVLQECKFFECTAVWPLVHQLGESILKDFERRDHINQKLAFLPAVVTWIECEYRSVRNIVSPERRANKLIHLTKEETAKVETSHKYRTAFVFVGPDNSTTFAQRWIIGYNTPRKESEPRHWRITRLRTLPLIDSGMQPTRVMSYETRDRETIHYDKPTAHIEDFVHYAYLSLINSPRVIGQRGHYPHGRIERELLKKLKLVGKFPLRAWTEILLQVHLLPEHREDAESEEMHLTGERCLHYCRTYLRARNGILEYVEGHWRGNPALGMKRSRYRLEKEKQS